MTEIEAKDVKRLLLRTYKRYKTGAITERQAMRESSLLNSVLKAIETTDLEEKLTNIETLLNNE